MARSRDIWIRRISILSTFYFIKLGQHKDTISISGVSLNDKNDLIHKAVGWMLREVGKRDYKLLINFTMSNYKSMHRTTLRYSIERFPKELRRNILAKPV